MKFEFHVADSAPRSVRIRTNSPLAGIVLLFLLVFFPGRSWGQQEKTDQTIEKSFISNVRQLTFGGLRAGEGYFNSDASLMVFQSERRADNPFFQIYLLDFGTGDIEPISPGHGKTTCSWIHPDNNQVLFSSTQDDPEARAKQKAELEFRESGQTRRYAWDYDSTFEIYAFDRTKKTYNRLTDAKGYDAEASYSPDGKKIAFASNRKGFSEDLSPEAKKKFEIDPAYMMDIYIMNADGTDVRQLTDVPGYDGGPFFSPDGSKICWRRFSEDGATAEVFTMNVDGTEQKQLTRMGALSWAPFFHPSSKYLIYTTNKHGFTNFELYLVAADGKSPPVRVTDSAGFDGLASFTPDGNRLTWTSGRTAKKDSQIFLADWNHENALKGLANAGFDGEPQKPVGQQQTSSDKGEKPKPKIALDQATQQLGKEAAEKSGLNYDPADLARYLESLQSADLNNNASNQSIQRASFISGFFEAIGLSPAGDNGGYQQEFGAASDTSTKQVEEKTSNVMTVDYQGEKEFLELGKDWRSLSCSSSVTTSNASVVFAGYGIIAPEQGSMPAYDSLADLDVRDKWVMVLDGTPENVSPERKQHLEYHGSLTRRAFHARERGARGIIVVSPFGAAEKLPAADGSAPLSGNPMGVIALNNRTADDWLIDAGSSLQKATESLAEGKAQTEIPIAGMTVSVKLTSIPKAGNGINLLARLQAGTQPSAEVILVGASFDPMKSSDSSGVAGLLKIAQQLAQSRKDGKLTLKRDILFAVWGNGESAMQGSRHFIDSLNNQNKKISPPVAAQSGKRDFVLTIAENGATRVNGEEATDDQIKGSFAYLGKNHPEFEVKIVASSQTSSKRIEDLKEMARSQGVTKIALTTPQAPTVSTSIWGVIHLDRIGSLNDKLLLQGVASSPDWGSVVESKNIVVGLPLATLNDAAVPNDSYSFYAAGIPVLSAFSGSGDASNGAQKPNLDGAAKISQLMGLIARSLANADEVPKFVRQELAPTVAPRRGGRVSLGTHPSYGDDIVGVKLTGVTPGSPAEKAGVQADDIIVGLDGQEIENINDYSNILNELKADVETELVIERAGKRMSLKITPVIRK